MLLCMGAPLNLLSLPASCDAEFHAILLQPELYDVLLCLADLCPDYMVRQNVMKLLDVIPTDEQIVRQLRAVLSSINACDSMRQLLIGSGVVKPARLLYTLQVTAASLYGGLMQRHIMHIQRADSVVRIGSGELV